MRRANSNNNLVIQPNSQRCRTRIVAASKLAEVMSTLRPKCLSHVAAASQPNIDAWLKAIPAVQIGNIFGNDYLLINIVNRLGLKLCQPHLCRYSLVIDLDDLYRLSCQDSAGDCHVIRP